MVVRKTANWLDEVSPEEYWETRERLYKEFFGPSWKDIIDLGVVEDKAPEDAVKVLEDDLDYCENCGTYFLINPNQDGVYYCPYCGALGAGSAPDYKNEKEVHGEHLWETMNDR